MTKGGFDPDGTEPTGRPLLPYRPEVPLGGAGTLSSGKRLLVVLFFVPPVVILALLVVWAFVRR